MTFVQQIVVTKVTKGLFIYKFSTQRIGEEMSLYSIY